MIANSSLEQSGDANSVGWRRFVPGQPYGRTLPAMLTFALPLFARLSSES
jgi:hypothetical protein